MTEIQADLLIAQLDLLGNVISIPLSIIIFLITFFGLIYYFRNKI